ncbi:DUF6443 domain-containing protein [Flavobacterium gelatinilyticum]|uniref:DUF6443 domain-containing protein n=1 Tax=Flavobacterium gelatinilyticum TaxID=3003260 RepID=UPI0024810792|nr:DUF6443 domain-containing protein [Flavobacterium gelatinilyticum]
MISNKLKNTIAFIVLMVLIFFNTSKIQAQSTGQLYLTGPTTVHYGDIVSYSLKDAMDNNAPSSTMYNNFNWMAVNNGTVLTYINENYQPDAEIYWDGSPNQEKVYVTYKRQGESDQYYAELNVTVLSSPSTPDAPTVLSSGCNQVVLQRSNPPGNVRTGGQDITWYWQSTPTGTSTANSASTITITSGTEYFLRARRNNGSLTWSDSSSSVQYFIGVRAPIVSSITQPNVTTPTGSVTLSGLPSTGNWVINPGNITGTGDTKTITGLSPATTYNFTVTNSTGCTSAASANIVINAQSSSLTAPLLSSVTQPNCINSKGEFTITNYNSSYTYTASPSTGVTILGAKVMAPQGSYTFKAVSGTVTSPPSAAVIINAQPATPAPPIVGTITHPTLTTATGSVLLSGLPNNGWKINPGNISGSGTSATITGLKAGLVHNLTVTTSAGCTSAPSANIVINLQPFVCSGISNENYVHTIIPLIKTTDIATLANNQKQESITYYDGLGRPKQQIAIRSGGGTYKDIITHIDYDDFGRQTKEYLPYTDGNDCGAFRTADIDLAAKTYYKTKYPADINAAAPNPYSEKDFEPSPLNRVLKQAAPGNSWKLGEGHEIKLKYQTNTDADAVKLFTVEFLLENNIYVPVLKSSGLYTKNVLYKNSTYDENTAANPVESDGSTIEFKNKEGQIILKRTYGTVEKGTTNERHDTYYVYDDFGNLSFVIPPKAVDLLGSANIINANLTSTAVIEPAPSSPLHLKASNSITLTTGFHAKAGSTFSAIIDNGNKTVLDNLCYQYVYDKRNRLIEKKLPGKGWEYIVYDKQDRPILTQDANLRENKKWLFTKYDVFNRTVYTGEYTNTVKTTRPDVQLLADANTVSFETKQSANTINGTTVYYSNTTFPNNNDANISLFTINYYDDYSFDSIPVDISSIGAITNTKGLSTGSKVRILTTNNWITNWNYYDDKSRVIYSYSKNDYLITTDIVQSQFDFVGKIMQTISKHTRSNVTTTITDTFTYDQTGRLTKQTQAINGAATAEVIAVNTYDELGQLVSKAVGGKESQNRLQTIDYKYNIRGWLKNINDVNAMGTDLFAFQINYNDAADNLKRLYNGNISQTSWKTANSDTSLKSYTYTYDKLNRLLKADDNLNKFNESINYDKNGNITNLVRMGELVGGTIVPVVTNPSHFGTMDNLVYTYDKGNQLQIVSDTGNKTYGFKDDYTGTGADTTIDYTYDVNGNMKTDTNKGITAISYNHLNLPTIVTIAGQNINYVYDATGVKQRKIANTITTDYAGGFIYEGGLLKFFSQPEGYISYNSGAFDYIYQYKDHLGNVRLSYDKNLAIQEENNYYPFGLKHKGYNYVNNITLGNSIAQRYKYNGKELQDELQLNVYDYGARNYDPALSRWMNIDPLAEKNPSQTPFLYCNANPVIFMDPDGKDGIIVIKGGQITISSKVYLYGEGATKSVVSQMQKDINAKWGGTFSSKSLDGKQYFKVNVKVKVGLYEGKEKNDPFIIPENWDPDNRDNFIEVNDDVERSYVRDGDEGKWKSTGRSGKTLAQDDSAPHEVGHLLGLIDRYTDERGPNSGWGSNIMAKGPKGKVQQRNIDGILLDAMKAYDEWSKDKNNKDKEFRYEINGRPNK